MKSLLELVVNVCGRHSAQRLEYSCRAPRAAQRALLERIVHTNRDTAFGRAHGFATVRTLDEYRLKVPVRDYEALRPWVDRIADGDPYALTADPPFMFNMTSGTTAEPKRIPWNREADSVGTALVRQWIYRCRRDHPRLFDGTILALVSPAIEGYTASGIPCGSTSGRIYQRIPRCVRSRYALPYEVTAISDYETRYFIAARIAMEQRVSCVSTPNPSTLLQLAETAAANAERIIRAIHDGVPGAQLVDGEADGAIRPSLRANPHRARELEAMVREDGTLMPRRFWPDLQLIGCWTGGSVGARLPELRHWYGEQVPVRDLGYLASEARMSLPVEDGTASGVLAIDGCFFEFLPEEERGPAEPLLCDELEAGGRYRVLLTGPNGLYRYDINDVIEVTGFHHRCPLVRFLRKGRDVTSLTGEKLHVNHCLAAMASIAGAPAVAAAAFRFVANAEANRYDVYVEATPERSACLARVIDRALSRQNIEYAKKRRAGQLAAPSVVAMRAGWADAVRRAAVESGRRDVEFKWRHLSDRPDPLDQRFMCPPVPAAGTNFRNSGAFPQAARAAGAPC